MSKEKLVFIYDTWGSGAGAIFARVREYKRKLGYRVTVLYKYYNGGWKTIASKAVMDLDEAAEFVAKNTLASKEQVLAAFKENGLVIT